MVLFSELDAATTPGVSWARLGGLRMLENISCAIMDL